MTQTNTPGLLELPTPSLEPSQIEQFRRENITAVRVASFDPLRTLNALKATQGSKSIGIDIGGDKSLTRLYEVEANGKLATDDSYSELIHDSEGNGYLESLEKTAQFAEQNNLPVGLSVGLTMDGTRPSNKDGMKLPILREKLKQQYAYDFANIFKGNLACFNDGPAGLVSGAIQASLQLDSEITDVIYVINGGGVGAAVLKNGVITATEAGHVSLVSELNKYNETRICHRMGKDHLCFEYAASNKLGIEDIWRRKTGENLSAIDIEKKFTGNQPDGPLALEIYDYSAWLVSHLIKGLGNTFGIDINSPQTVVVGHGGAFKFPGYGERIKQILSANGDGVQLIMTKDYSDNACAEGAAIAALTL